MKIKFKKFSQRARAPTQGTKGSAGYDLHFVEERLVSPCSSVLVQTDVGLKIPKVFFWKIHTRSSWTVQITGVGSGVIDSDYRGKVGVIFFNFSNNFYQICVGDKIAQIVFQKIRNPTLEEISNFDDKTTRGEGGFGSTTLPNHVKKICK